ncbi:hypothetical protein [Nitratireductor sp. GZWM139]|uniref:hypothetical protein n=1 Tax=Nitratireductor sp. GZWM139 TaxID=2950541 RepID=UPI0024BDFD3F|nr:hypothetical protein [Nitratireductor sp. GZWM139]MDJ1465292.1 hypothetical protein [Nitratireductor sp. GZWM139]
MLPGFFLCFHELFLVGGCGQGGEVMRQNMVFGAVAFGVVLSVQVVAQENPTPEQPMELRVIQEGAAERSTMEAEPIAPAISSAEPSGTKFDDSGARGGGKEPTDPEQFSWYGDTPAQWAMTIIGFFALTVSVWAVWLLKRTLDATRETLKEAERTAEAAKLALFNDRAWLCFERPRITLANQITVDGQSFAEGIVIYLLFRNGGRTPATHVGVEREGSIADVSDEAYPLVDFDSEAFNGTAIVAASSNFESAPLSIVGEELQRFRRREVKFCAHAFVGYRDIFEKDKKRLTEVVVEFMYMGEGKDGFGNIVPQLSSGIVGRRNRAE